MRFGSWQRQCERNHAVERWGEIPAGASEVEQIAAVRAQLANRFIRGVGLEVGAGDRPFPVAAHTRVLYGDIRDRAALQAFFKTKAVTTGETIDAQTLAGLKDRSFDFVISAHVIEHLRDPIGAIVNAIRLLRRGGIHIVVVPDMRRTFDRQRPETTVAHALADFHDGGGGTCRQAYEEHLRFVHPILTGQTYSETEIQRQASESARLWPKYDVHFHAWLRPGFEALLRAARQFAPFRIVHISSVATENLFVLCKTSQIAFGARRTAGKIPLPWNNALPS